METVGGRIDSAVENIGRSTRRSRSNKNITIKLNESKDQENVNNTGSAESKVDTPVQDVAKSSALDDKLISSSPNLNSSTPRRKKDPLANLHSNLSPKYIGFSTPPNHLNSSTEERTRSLRKRHNNSNSTNETFEENVKDKDVDITFTPNTESTVGFVRRTPRNKEAQLTPENSIKRKKFVSPIDKLLIKNGAVMEFNNNLPAISRDEFISESKVLVNSKSMSELDKKELGVRELDVCEDETENKVTPSLFHKNYNLPNKNSKNSEITGTQMDGVKKKFDNSKETSENDETTSTTIKSEVDDDKEDNISISSEIAKQVDDDGDENSENEQETVEDGSPNQSSIDKDQSVHKAEPSYATYKDAKRSECVKAVSSFDCKIALNTKQCKVLLANKDSIEKPQYAADEKQSSAERFNYRNGISADKKVNVEASLAENKTAKILKIIEENKGPVIKIELESPENENTNEFVDAPTATANSPSAVSMDSAKGSSIINEGSWMSFTTGDLYWGQIYNFCYWPCMVCPDPNGKTITAEEVGRSGDHSVLVHVRFFADNGRRNWVKRENLMPFTGMTSYQERIVEIREKYGSKSTKYKLYVPTKKKEQVWFDAVNEANMVAEVAYANRLEKFYEIFEKSKAFHKLQKQRRKSLYISVNSGTGSDFESFYGSNDTINNLSLAAAMKNKRERSISPYSPAYSPIKSVAAKRRKLSGDPEPFPASSKRAILDANADEREASTAANNLSETHSVDFTSYHQNSFNDLDLYNSLEFRKLYGYMKDYVMEQNHDENLEKSLVVAVRNIWALRQLNRRQIECKLRDSLTEADVTHALALTNSVRATSEGSMKRLSSRLKNLVVRKSLMAQHNRDETPDRSEASKPLAKETPNADKVKKPMNRPMLEVIDDIFGLDSKYLFRGMSREPVCKYCLKPGGNLRKCAMNCTYWLHKDCLHKDFTKKARRGTKPINGIKTVASNDSLDVSESAALLSLTEVAGTGHVTGDSETVLGNVTCKECANNEPPKCMVCNSTDSKKENDALIKCSMAQCERSFHTLCCKYWPQAKITISKNVIESFRCPSHVCHTCVSDDPKGKFQHLSNAKLTKCVKCPATFHTDSTCIPAGSQILTAAHIICPRHMSSKQDMMVNVNWCFICVGGGQLMCCETCPTAVHAHCLQIPIAANEGYICEECESGRMPLYGEMVWAKFNHFRWWPAIILPPTEIPKNIARKTHNPSEFVVRFFGTHDHGWISRRRVYLYLEGDSSEPPKTKSNLDLSYNKGVAEAKEVYEVIKAKKLQQRSQNGNKAQLHPQPYVRIKVNRAVPPVKLHVDIESVSKCECDAREESPCGPDTNCLNRVLYHECNPKVCPAGERCQNQMFESRVSPRLDVVYMNERGFGLVCREPIKAGTFIIEYVGEIINDDEFQARMQQKSRDRDENFYFLSVEKDYIIDAGPKGNLARFMNHSCDPNCETQKWSVNSLNRVGLFAIKDIPENTELTFNYHWDDLLGNEKKTCYCGAKKCAGQIGAKLKDLETVKPPAAIQETGRTGKLKTKPNNKNNNKSKPNPNKKLLNNRGLKNKLASKLKLKAKATTITKKVTNDLKKAAAVAAAAANTSHSLTEEPEASTSRLLESPDLFA